MPEQGKQLQFTKFIEGCTSDSYPLLKSGQKLYISKPFVKIKQHVTARCI